MREQWKTIKEFPDYEISTRGRIWSKPRLVRGRYVGGTFLTLNVAGNVTLNGKHSYSPARLMLCVFVRAPRTNECALHKDDIRSNNLIENLYWGTKKQNYQDAIRNGRKGFPVGKDLAARNRKLWKMGVYAKAAEKQWITKRIIKEFL